MIVAFVREKTLIAAILDAASPEEDVFVGIDDGLDAIYHGFPRLVILGGRREHPFPNYAVMPDVPILRLGVEGAAGWWRHENGPHGRGLRRLIDEASGGTSWVDELFRGMVEASGVPLPPAFKGFCRRVLEYPGRYSDMHALTDLTGLSRGALKARFRRKGLRSPTEHIRWLRVLAAGHVLGSSDATTANAAYRLGFTSDGNLGRVTQTVVGANPAALRLASVRTSLLVDFVQRFVLDAGTMGRWARFDEVFSRRAVA